MNNILKRLYNCILSALPKAGKNVLWLLKIILPISLAVSLLQYWGIIAQIASILAPVFSLIGLPGESAIVFISSIFLTLYAPIAIIATLPLDMREITILALMCLISHNMIMETVIQKKTGSSAIIMFTLRICASFVGAFLLNLLLPEHVGSSHVIQEQTLPATIIAMLTKWAISAGWLILKITLIVTGLMILQNILKEFNILNILSRIFSPFMRIFGLSNDSSFLWFVAQIIGLTYGSAILIDGIKRKEISLTNANLLNYHIALNHSLLEDTLLFVAIGVPAGWIMVPRFVLAIIAVWGVHAIAKLKQSKQKRDCPELK